MTEPRVQVFETTSALSQATAQLFATAVREAVRQNGQALVALSGGSSPVELFHLLAQPPFNHSLAWGQVHFFWGDERCVPPDDPESSYGLARRLLFDFIPVPPANIHRAQGELPPPVAAADYTAQLAAFGAPGRPWPAFDLVLLGMGADGHTASLFPGQVNPQEATAAVIAVTASYQGRPANRVTLTPPIFNSARRVLFLVSGATKAASLAATLQGPLDPLHLPAQRIRPAAGSLTWLVDREAAALLKPSGPA